MIKAGGNKEVNKNSDRIYTKGISEWTELADMKVRNLRNSDNKFGIGEM